MSGFLSVHHEISRDRFSSMRKFVTAASCCLLGAPSLAWHYQPIVERHSRFHGSRQLRLALTRRHVSSEDGYSEDDVSSESFELMSARSRLAGQWAAQEEAELPATDARSGAIDAGACVLAALNSGEQRFTVDVEVPFLDRKQPELYEPPRAAQFAYELALRVATARRKSVDSQEQQLSPPPVFVVFSTEAEATEATEAWGSAAVKRGIVAVAVAKEDGRGYKGKARTWSPSVDPDALANVKPQLRKAIEAYYAAAASTSSSSAAAPSSAACSRPSFVVVCPQNGAELIASRAAIEWADGDAEVAVGGRDEAAANESNSKLTPGAVVMLNPKFSLPPREMATFQCVFGLVPFKVQAKGALPSKPGERSSAFQPSVVVLKRFGRPWQMFIDGNGRGHVFCGSFGESATRPSPKVLLPTVGAYLQRLALRKEAPGTTAAVPAEDNRAPFAEVVEENSRSNNRPDRNDDDDATETVSYLDRIFALIVDDAPYSSSSSSSSSSSVSASPEDVSTRAEAPSTGSDSPPAAPNSEEGGNGSRRRDGEEGAPSSSSSSSVDFLNRVFNQPAASSPSDSSENI